ncbi:hypothetical protein C9374_011355 [Naegleria lovaniensis]|uniref:Uncharacterized protein n=1 Tax=Naegleria lovaniensis TaxID=51637 RepID=A0AA88GX79_NAELO|nr:uncharacterized protein C9374_011355 [Naegleria lovaniensis]KAG2392630.1 hypothetical protein C9374_011355 [Naegleria lovaniensis]
MKLSIVSFQKDLSPACSTTVSPNSHQQQPCPPLFPSTHLDTTSFRSSSKISKKRNSKRKDGLVMTQRTEIVEPCESQFFNDPHNGCMFYSFPLVTNGQKRTKNATTPNKKKRKNSAPCHLNGLVPTSQHSASDCNSSSDSSPHVFHLHQISFDHSTHALIENETPNFVKTIANNPSTSTIQLRNHHKAHGDHSKPMVLCPVMSSTSANPIQTHLKLHQTTPSSCTTVSHPTHSPAVNSIETGHIPAQPTPPVRLSISIKELLNHE